VGRDGAACSITVAAENLVKAKQHAVQACRKGLPPGGNIYLEARGHYTYGIILGMDEVGKVTITRLADRLYDAE
jgi:hypothetical protein